MIKLLQRWLNYPPERNARYITDKYGEKFWLFWNIIEQSHCLSVSYRGKSVGVVDLFWKNPPEVILSDLHIFKHSKMRGRGLSKPMIQEAIRWAKEHDASFIWGWIQPHDGSSEEQLIHLYQSQGFTIETNQHGRLIIELPLKENFPHMNNDQTRS